MNALTLARMMAGPDFNEGLEAAIFFGITEGAKQERRRVSEIVNCPEAEGRQGSALQIALMDVAFPSHAAREVLAGLARREDAAANVVDVAARRAAMKIITDRGY